MSQWTHNHPVCDNCDQKLCRTHCIVFQRLIDIKNLQAKFPPISSHTPAKPEAIDKLCILSNQCIRHSMERLTALSGSDTCNDCKAVQDDHPWNREQHSADRLCNSFHTNRQPAGKNFAIFWLRSRADTRMELEKAAGAHNPSEACSLLPSYPASPCKPDPEIWNLRTHRLAISTAHASHISCLFPPFCVCSPPDRLCSHRKRQVKKVAQQSILQEGVKIGEGRR